MSETPIPQEQAVETLTGRRSLSIGLPKATARVERRFPLTPEGAAMLVERGFTVLIERGAAECIHFADEAYARLGARIVERPEALGADVVLYLPAIEVEDIAMLKPGGALLTLQHSESRSTEAVRTLLDRRTITIALDLISNGRNRLPVADILREVDGRAAMALASSLLADPILGKGILLGGVAGVVPCEVTIIGSDIAAIAAARTAVGLGATVRLFDDDVYSLREAVERLNGGNAPVIASALHPRVIASALHTADIVIVTNPNASLSINSDMDMKRGVIAFDLTDSRRSSIFPSLERIDLAEACAGVHGRDALAACYVNAGSAVPRTAAMALSTTLLSLADAILPPEGIVNALRFDAGLRRAALTFGGKAVNDDIARIAGCRVLDINLLLQFQ